MQVHDVAACNASLTRKCEFATKVFRHHFDFRHQDRNKNYESHGSVQIDRPGDPNNDKPNIGSIHPGQTL